jgi:2Fe-2S ferredoxin
MPKVTYIEFDGSEHPVEVEAGYSAMEGALRNGVPGIDGDCGGMAACATCHVFVDETWLDRVGPPVTEQETEMLGLATERKANSRLACQIELSPALDGLVLRMPEKQF